MYCLKCRRVTETENIATVTSKNDRLMRRRQCVTCRKIKCHFDRKDGAGGSFLNSLVNKLPFEMHLPGHNFTGPGTKLNKRLNPDGTPKECIMPKIELTTRPINTIYVIQNTTIRKLGMRFAIKQCLAS